MSDKKSFIAKIEDAILRFTKPDYMDSVDEAVLFLKNKENTKPSSGIFRSVDFNGTQVFTFGNENAQNTILYTWRSLRQ